MGGRSNAVKQPKFAMEAAPEWTMRGLRQLFVALYGVLSVPWSGWPVPPRYGMGMGESGLTTHAVMSWQCALEIKNLTYCAVQQARYFDSWAGSPHPLDRARAFDDKTRHGTRPRTRTTARTSGAAGFCCRAVCILCVVATDTHRQDRQPTADSTSRGQATVAERLLCIRCA